MHIVFININLIDLIRMIHKYDTIYKCYTVVQQRNKESNAFNCISILCRNLRFLFLLLIKISPTLSS